MARLFRQLVPPTIGWLVLVVTALGGCHLLGGTEDLYIDEALAPDASGTGSVGGFGGAAPTSSTSTGVGGDDTSGVGGAGGAPCVPENCPGVDSQCATRACIDSVCGMIMTQVGTMCGDPADMVCDGEGNCVQCVIDDDCTSNNCQENICYSADCSDGTQNGDETDEDCGGSCSRCDNGQDCFDGSDCLSTLCLGTICAGCSDHPDCAGGWYCDPVDAYCKEKKNAFTPCDFGYECKSNKCTVLCELF
jgi:hypothetical protein